MLPTRLHHEGVILGQIVDPLFGLPDCRLGGWGLPGCDLVDVLGPGDHRDAGLGLGHHHLRGTWGEKLKLLKSVALTMAFVVSCRTGEGEKMLDLNKLPDVQREKSN